MSWWNILNKIVNAITVTTRFLPRDAIHKRGLCRQSVRVRPSVCLSATFVDHVKTNKYIFEIFSPSGSHTILVFPVPKGAAIFQREPPNEGVECKGVWKNHNFRPISRSISETVIVRCSETICKHRILFPSIWHLAWLPHGRPQGKPKCGKNSDFCTYALT